MQTLVNITPQKTIFHQKQAINYNSQFSMSRRIVWLLEVFIILPNGTCEIRLEVD